MDSAVLVRSNFDSAEFQYSDMRRANMQGSSFKHADFSGADLSGADVYLADFAGADLRGTNRSGIVNWSYAKISPTTKLSGPHVFDGKEHSETQSVLLSNWIRRAPHKRSRGRAPGPVEAMFPCDTRPPINEQNCKQSVRERVRNDSIRTRVRKDSICKTVCEVVGTPLLLQLQAMSTFLCCKRCQKIAGCEYRCDIDTSSMHACAG